jgi:hypothetical protein
MDRWSIRDDRVHRSPERLDGAIVGRVTLTDGEPIPDASIVIVGGPAHRDIAALTTNQGEYSLQSLTPGDYVLLVNASGFDAQIVQARVEAGNTTRLNFSFSAWEPIPEL